MLARFVLGAVAAGAVIAPALAGQMNAEEARRFVAGKIFAFTCFDGTRGAGRVFDDGGAAGVVQLSGFGLLRHMRLPGNTLQVRGQMVCASIKGIPFEPCFNLDKKDESHFRGSVSGLGFAYCDFRHQGAGRNGSMVSAGSKTMLLESLWIEPVRSEPALSRQRPEKSRVEPLSHARIP